MFASSIVAALMLFASSSFAAAPRDGHAHPYHKSLTQIEYDEERGALECSLWVWPNDLIEELEARSGKGVDLDTLERAGKLDALLLVWLRDVIRVRDASGQRLRARWVGKELSLDSCWLHFEYVGLAAGGAGKRQSLEVENRAFFAIAKLPMHTVTFEQGGKRQRHNLTRRAPRWRLPVRWKRQEKNREKRKGARAGR